MVILVDLLPSGECSKILERVGTKRFYDTAIQIRVAEGVQVYELRIRG